MKRKWTNIGFIELLWLKFHVANEHELTHKCAHVHSHTHRHTQITQIVFRIDLMDDAKGESEVSWCRNIPSATQIYSLVILLRFSMFQIARSISDVNVFVRQYFQHGNLIASNDGATLLVIVVIQKLSTLNTNGNRGWCRSSGSP